MLNNFLNTLLHGTTAASSTPSSNVSGGSSSAASSNSADSSGNGSANGTMGGTSPTTDANVNPLLGPLLQISAQPQQQQQTVQMQLQMPIQMQMQMQPQMQQQQQQQQPLILMQPQQQQQFQQMQLPTVQLPVALPIQAQPQQHQPQFILQPNPQMQQQPLPLTPEQHQRLLMQLTVLQQQRQQQQPPASAFTLQQQTPVLFAAQQQQQQQQAPMQNPLMLALGQPAPTATNASALGPMTNPTGGQALQLFSSDVFAASSTLAPANMSGASTPAPLSPAPDASSPLAGSVTDIDSFISTTSQSAPPTATTKRGTGRPRGRPRGSKTGASAVTSRAAIAAASTTRSGLRRSASASSDAPAFATDELSAATTSTPTTPAAAAGGKAPRRTRGGSIVAAKAPRHPPTPPEVNGAADGPGAVGKVPRIRRTNQNMGKAPRAAMVAAHAVAAASAPANADNDGDDDEEEGSPGDMKQRGQEANDKPAGTGRGPRISTNAGKAAGKGVGKAFPMPTTNVELGQDEAKAPAPPAAVDVVPREEQSFKVYFPDLVATMPLPIAVLDPDNPSADVYGFASSGVSGKRSSKGGKGKGKSRVSSQPLAPESTPSGQPLVIQPSGPLKPVPAIEFYELPDSDDTPELVTHFAMPADGSYLAYTPHASQIEYDLDDRDRAWVDAYTPHLPHLAIEHALDTLDKSWHSLTSRLPHGVGVTGGLHVDDGHCCVCGDDECENANAIVFCDGCNIAVHQECYGVVNIPEGQWLCRRCETQSPPNTPCVLCGQPGGALKQATDSRWVHVLCALWIQEAQIVQIQIMEPIDISGIPSERYALVCSVCKQRRGACIQCSKGTCCTAFHVTCARQVGLVMHNATHRVLCERHGSVGHARKRPTTAVTGPDKRASGASRPSTRGAAAAAAASASGPATPQRKVFRSSAILDSDEDDEVGKIVHVRTGTPALTSVFGPLGSPSSSSSAYHDSTTSANGEPSRHPFEFDPAHPVVNAFVYTQLKLALPDITDADLIALCKLWAVKRALRGGGPLLRRLVIDQSVSSLAAPSSMTGTRDAHGAGSGIRPETRVALIVLRHELERIRVMSDQLRKRERLRAQAVGIMCKAWTSVSLALKTKLLPLLDKIVAVDTRRIFAEPVDTDLITGYLDLVAEPMDFATVQKKLDFGLYGTVGEFRADLQLIWDNCKEFNPPETVYYRAAVACEEEATRLLDAFEEQIKARDKLSVPIVGQMDDRMWPYNPRAMERVAEEATSGIKGGRGVLAAYRKRILAETAAGRTRLTRRMIADGAVSGGEDGAPIQPLGLSFDEVDESGEAVSAIARPPRRPRTPSPPPPEPIAYAFDEPFITNYASPAHFPKSMPIGSIAWVRIDPPGIWWPMRVIGVDRDWLERASTQWPPETLTSGAPHPWVKKLKKDVHSYRYCMPLYFAGTTTHSGMWLRVQRLHAMTREKDEQCARVIRDNKEGHTQELMDAAIAAYERVMQTEPQWERKKPMEGSSAASKKGKKKVAMDGQEEASGVSSTSTQAVSTASSGPKKRRMTADDLVMYSFNTPSGLDGGHGVATRGRRASVTSPPSAQQPAKKRLRIVGLPPPPPPLTEPTPAPLQSSEDDGASLTDLSDPDEVAGVRAVSRNPSPVRGRKPRITLTMDLSSPLTTPNTSAPTSARSTSPVHDSQAPLPTIVLRASRHSGSPEHSVTPKRPSITGARTAVQPVRTPSPLLSGSPAGSPTPRANRRVQAAIRPSSSRHLPSSPKARSPVRSKSPLRKEIANANSGPVLDTDDEFEQELDHAASSDDLMPPLQQPQDAPDGYEPRHIRASTLDTNPLLPGEVVYVDRSSSGASTPASPPRPKSRSQRRPPSSPVIALPSPSPTKDTDGVDGGLAVRLSEEQVADQPNPASVLLDEEISIRALAKNLPFNQLSREEQLAIKRMRERERKRKLMGRAGKTQPPLQPARNPQGHKASSRAPSRSQSSALSTPVDSSALSPVRTRRSAASSASASRAATPPPPLPSRQSASALPVAKKRGRTFSASSVDSVTSISSASSSSSPSPVPSDVEGTPSQKHEKALARRRERDRVRRAEAKAQRLAKLGIDSAAALETSFRAHNVRDETGRFMKLEKLVELGLIPVGDDARAASTSGRRERKRKNRSPSPGGSDTDAGAFKDTEHKSKARRVDAASEQRSPVATAMSASGGSKRSAKKSPPEPPASARRAERLREAGTAPAQKVTLFEAFNQIEANAATLGLRASRRVVGTVTPTPTSSPTLGGSHTVGLDKEQGFVGKGKSKAKPGAKRPPSSRRKTRGGAGSPVSVSELSDLSE